MADRVWEQQKIAKRVERKIADIVSISLSDGQFSYGRVLAEPLIAFYDFVSESEADAETFLSQPVKYTLLVMNNAVTSGRWCVIGQANLDADLQKPVRFSSSI